jgi:hypothetical protein
MHVNLHVILILNVTYQQFRQFFQRSASGSSGTHIQGGFYALAKIEKKELEVPLIICGWIKDYKHTSIDVLFFRFRLLLQLPLLLIVSQ